MTDHSLDSPWDDDEFTLELWIAAEKSLREFEESLSAILAPIHVSGGRFSLGGIDCAYRPATYPPPEFAGIPSEKYTFVIEIPASAYLP